MNPWLDAVGSSIVSAVLRASWQAATLALVVAILLRVCGDRLTPHWRFFLWGVVLARLLLIITPGSTWSMFNLAPSNTALTFQPASQEVEYARIDPVRPSPKSNLRSTSSETELSFTGEKDQADNAILPVPGARNAPAGSSQDGAVAQFNLSSFSMLSIVWIFGCAIATLNLLWTHVLLRRRLSVCRQVTDPIALRLLSICSRQLRLQRTPALLVSPSHCSPFVVGAWNPRIVLPEAMLTDASAARLRHVLAHELAHLVRGDLATNWFLIAARILHWFNPIAWWTTREMQAERESACDELAFQVLGDADRTSYASTIVEMATIFGPVNLVPGFIGLFSSKGRLQLRVERLLRFPSISKLRTSIAGCICLLLALFGLTDAMQTVLAQSPKEKVAANDRAIENNFTLSGHCLESEKRTPLAGVTVKLYRLAGRTQPAVEIATTTSDATGRYVFPGLEKPRPEDHLDRLAYGVLGFAEDRPIGRSFHHFDKNDKDVTQIWMARESSVVFGKVVDSLGRPVEGATVLPYIIMDQPVASLHATKTDANGEFELEELGVVKWPGGEQVKVHFKVRHPDFPEVLGEAKSLPAELTVKLPAACIVQGSVTDSVTGKPGVGAVITARRTDEWKRSHFPIDAQGRFRIPLVEGSYDFIVEAKDRVCVATTGHNCLGGEKLDLPEMKLIAGGLISGNVVNTLTGEMVQVSDDGDTLMLGLIGPSQPNGPVISPHRMASVDKTGRFTLRAAPGDNFPYFVNTRGARMAWDTLQQAPVIVREGETTMYNMLITPEVPAQEKLAAARKLVETLSTKTSERTAQILLEFRKLNQTVDECETWCMLMRELVAIGSDAIPQLSAELDQTTEGPMLRRLAFALRAIGDVRAVPALIRAIPKTLQPSSSDYGLMVDDAELLSFMQRWDLDEKDLSRLFSLGRPVREVFGALQKLTGEDFSDAELYSMSLSEDVRCQVLQRNIFGRQAGRWQAWWQTHWKSLTDDTAYQTVDSGYRPKWPDEIPKDETASKSKQLADWAQNKGIDLMCMTHRSQEGKETFVLRAIGMKVQEINTRQLRDIERLISTGRLPEGRPVGELLMHFDEGSKQFVPEANAAFLFTTREGTMGIIEVTDRITRTADLTGQAAGMSTGGIGFHKGVQFNLSRIIP